GVEDARERLPEAVRSLDQPSIDGVNTYFVSEAAVRAGLKVAVSGVGGDELFGGYASFADLPRLRRLHEKLARVPGGRTAASGAARLLERLPRSRRTNRWARALDAGADDAAAYFSLGGLFAPSGGRALLRAA